MEGTFEVDKNRIDEFYHQYFFRVLKIVGIGIQLPLTILIIAKHKDSQELLSILFILVFLVILCFVSVESIRNRFEQTIIIIDKVGITRKGGELLTVSMNFMNVSKIIERQDGLILCTNTMALIFGGGYPLSHNPAILFIPSMIKDYEHIHNFFVLEKYKMTKSSKDK